MPIDVEESYDPMEDALVAAWADPGDHFAGIVCQATKADDKSNSGRVLRITLRLDYPFEDRQLV